MQDEVNEKVIALSIKTTKLTAEVLQKSICFMLSQAKKQLGKSTQHKGKQTLKQLRKQGAALSNVEITEANIKAFSKVAKEFQIDFALKKDPTTQPPRYIVFFKGNDKDTLEQAFRKFAYMTLNHDKKPSIRKLLSTMKEKAAAKNVERVKVYKKDRGMEL